MSSVLSLTFSAGHFTKASTFGEYWNYIGQNIVGNTKKFSILDTGRGPPNEDLLVG